MNDYTHLKLTKENQDIYFHLKKKVEIVKEETKNFRGRLLDVGCGVMPYKDIICKNETVTEYVGVDIKNDIYQKEIKPHFYWNGKQLPFENEKFDCAILIEVLEHVPDATSVLKELFRVLKPGANVLITVPFLWNLHDVPNDEFRYTPFSMKRICENAGFVIEKMEGLGGWHASLATSLSTFVRRAPMSKFRRNVFSVFFLPIVKYLFKVDRFNYNSMNFSESQMITGLKCVLKKQ
ncbi:MAG: class I SAM-dependent methyltransferase [Bacteroidetes bacterium]|nr:class I SAM-dependent methyltransferase [Bacteroidota bacterium]